MLNDGDEVVYPPSSGSFLHHLHLKEEAKKKGIKHFGHKHSLTFKEDVRNGFEDEDVLCCNGCGIEIERSGFSCCKERCSFNLHEFCASLPKEMKDYPQHPQHPLILYTHSPYPYPNSGFRCDVCKVYYPTVTSFCYHCEVCNFDVDLRCASMSFLVSSRTLHNHDLTVQLYPASFFCCFCSEKHREFGVSYQCKICCFWIHEQCYSLPQSIEHDSHLHPLKLWHIEVDLPKCLCGVCEENINTKFGLYGCVICKYGVHIKCSTKKWYISYNYFLTMLLVFRFY
ncbi:uncharacterized protein LOC124922404 [Impatiens glandulifera]|uniref:uncharacterized protein LOC124922404 n=1 Tax=Impatiens glandulifera TaxID=253017 RepID=UPI001FB0946E|nr:uncharacterized protein LOC124922404 [Impatiens glandulifera]